MVVLMLLVSLVAAQVSAVSPATQDPAANLTLLRLAVDLPLGEPVTAIPAEPDAAVQHALEYDWFRIEQIAARAAADRHAARPGAPARQSLHPADTSLASP